MMKNIGNNIIFNLLGNDLTFLYKNKYNNEKREITFNMFDVNNNDFVNLFDFLSEFMINNYSEINDPKNIIVYEKNNSIYNSINEEIVYGFIEILNSELENIWRFLIAENDQI